VKRTGYEAMKYQSLRTFLELLVSTSSGTEVQMKRSIKMWHTSHTSIKMCQIAEHTIHFHNWRVQVNGIESRLTGGQAAEHLEVSAWIREPLGRYTTQAAGGLAAGCLHPPIATTPALLSAATATDDRNSLISSSAYTSTD